MSMARVASFELFAVDLPFRKPFSHAAAVRTASDSLVLKCVTDSGQAGYGECLPRDYVTGETRKQVFELLEQQILPRLVGMEFADLEQLKEFLRQCDGKAPADWVAAETSQTAAWAAVDLALLDAFGRQFGTSLYIEKPAALDQRFRYSVVLSAHPGFKFLKNLAIARLYGFRQVKLKVEADAPEETVRTARRMLGGSCDIRVDANMAWDEESALVIMPKLSRYGVRSFEQPLAAGNISGLARLVRETGLGVMADESLNDAESLDILIAEKACTAVNVRISKCGGLMASYNRCLRALEAGLTIQVGCQVGESSLLSAAQLILIAAVEGVTYGEGCFGHHLLREDPVVPLLQFGYGGRPPQRPAGPGLGVEMDEGRLAAWVTKRAVL